VGVYGGMRMIQQCYTVPVQLIEGHLTPNQVIRVNGRRAAGNSYHRFGAVESRPALDVWAIADDGVVKAIRHADRSITGIMWHPERIDPFAAEDIALFRRVFKLA